MNAPVLSSLSSIDPGDSISNWSGWGQNSGKWALEADIIKEGSGSIGLAPSQTGDGGYGYDSISPGIDLTSNLLMIWVYTTPGFASVMASYGVYVRVCSGSSWTTEYSDFKVGGSDVAWFGRGWHLIVLDCNRTRDRGTGTTSFSSITRVGIGFNITATASKSTIMAIDAMYYGTGIEVTGTSLIDASNGIDLNDNGGSDDSIDRNDGGSFVTDGWEIGDFVKVTGATDSDDDGVYEITGVAASTLTIPTGSFTTGETAGTAIKILCSITLEDIYQKDGPTDDNWYGVIDKDPSGAYIVNYPLVIGDASGSNDIFFLSRGESIVLADQPLDGTREDYLITAEDTGETHLLFGDSSGTGDDRVGFKGSVIVGQGTVFDDGGSTSSSVKTPRGVDFSAEITSQEVFGTSFVGCDGGIDLAATASGHYLTTLTFDGCGQVDIGGAEARNITFAGYLESTGAALLWNESIDLELSNFLANSQAIEHPSAAGTPYAYTGLTFAGNTYDINNTSGSAITINATDSNPGTYTGSSVTINNPVNHTVSNLRTGDRVIWIRVSDGAELENLVESGGEATYAYQYGGSAVPVDVQVLSGDYTKKNTLTRVSLTDTDSGFPAVQANDPTYNNP